jgi:hypothetical protein
MISTRVARRIALLISSVVLCALVAAPQTLPRTPAQDAAQPSTLSEHQTMVADPVPALLDDGFQKLYSLDFQTARQEFASYQKARPNDPMGKAAEAASYLFEELNDKGVLSSDFFLNDDKFLKGLDGNPEENANPSFVSANEQARGMAKQNLHANAGDTNAMLVLTMTDGMESDYDQIIERKQIPAVSLTRQAEGEASTLLALDPAAKDAYVALGAGHYIIGCLPAFKRAFLWFGGIHGDRERGIEEMQVAAAQGHYLRPFAKILLALAYRREHEPGRARVLLAELSEEFPANTRFAYELSLLEPASRNNAKQCCE